MPPVLQDNDLDFFSENSFVVLPGVLADQVNERLDDISNLKDNLYGQPELVLETESEEVHSIFSPVFFSEAYHRLANNEYLRKAAEQILDSEVYIHYSRINIKAGLSG